MIAIGSYTNCPALGPDGALDPAGSSSVEEVPPDGVIDRTEDVEEDDEDDDEPEDGGGVLRVIDRADGCTGEIERCCFSSGQYFTSVQPFSTAAAMEAAASSAGATPPP